jgi:hypothetical protein
MWWRESVALLSGRLSVLSYTGRRPPLMVCSGRGFYSADVCLKSF